MSYKLIKEYPGSPEVGTIVSTINDKWTHYFDAISAKDYKKDIVENYPEFWKKLENPLFVTEDGVNIYMDDPYWPVNTVFDTFELRGNSLSGQTPEYKYFSTKAKALEYIRMNKPKYSEKNIKNVCNKLADSFREYRLYIDADKFYYSFMEKLYDEQKV